MLQEEALQLARHRAQAVLEMHLPRGAAVPVRHGPQALLAVVGEQARQRDQGEVRVQFLLDQALAAAVEPLHAQAWLGCLVQVFDSPAGVIQVGEVPDAGALAVA